MHPGKRIFKDVCERHCYYYKPGRDEEACGGLIALQKLVEAGHKLMPTLKVIETITPEIDAIINRRVCLKCEWVKSDCDYRDPAMRDARPCGGVAVISYLLVTGNIHENDIA